MRWLTLLVGGALALPASGTAGDGTVRLKLRAQVLALSPRVTLGEVLILVPSDDPLCNVISTEPVWPKPETSAGSVVTHEQIEQRLGDLGVDLTRVLLEGAAACRITPPAPEASAGKHPAGAAASPTRPTSNQGGAVSGGSLADVLKAQIGRDTGELGGTAEVEFEEASRPYLDLTTPPFEFSIQPLGHEKLGLREFRVVVRREGRTQRIANVFARVRLSKPVLVARQPLSVGTFVERDQVGVEQRIFEREDDVGFDRVEKVIGQQVARFVPPAQMLRRDDLKSVELVQRSRPVSIVGGGRGVHVQLSGVALDSGHFGDSVRVRLGDTRKSRTVLRGVVTGVGTVNVAEEGG